MKVGGYFFSILLVSTELQILFATQLKASLTGRESATRRFLISDHLCSVSNVSTHIGLQIISQSRIVVHKTISQTNLTTTLILLEINLPPK